MLYTGKGDNGTTKLFDCTQGQRISKADFVFEVLGSLDELNSSLGHAKSLSLKSNLFLYQAGKKVPYDKVMEKLQNYLFCVQAEIGGSNIHLDKNSIDYIEKIILDVELMIPPINSFIIVGGGETGSYLDVVRTLARKTERKLVILSESKSRDVGEFSLAFLNRLSSVLYALARFANYQEGFVENKPKYG